MGFFSLSRILWLLPVAVVVATVYLSKNPLCIDSRTVERLDRIADGRIESAWRCRLRRDVPWSRTLFRDLPALSRRIETVEDALWRIEAFQSPLRLTILADRPWFFRVEKGSIVIGAKLVVAEGHLERAFVKAWLIERNPAFARSGVHEEAVADLVTAILRGTVAFEDPFVGLRTRTDARWPHALKGASHYCTSPWKFSEHFETCGRNAESLAPIATSASLRPFLSSALMDSWQNMNLRDRIGFLRQLPGWLASYASPVPMADDRAIAAAMKAVRGFPGLFEVGVLPFDALGAVFRRKLAARGFTETDDRIDVDVLIVSEVTPALKGLSEVADQGRLKIAVRDGRGLTILPGRLKLQAQDLDDIRVHRMAVIRCGGFDFDWALSFEGVAQKLFVVDACDRKAVELRSWLIDGAEGFAKANPGVRFVQLHLPSLAMKKPEIDRAADVMKAIASHQEPNSVARSLGWSEVMAVEETGAYRPRAPIDAIEWFRLN